MFRVNVVMTGCLKNRPTADRADAGGGFRTGGLAALKSDRYVKIKDRAKDIIIGRDEYISPNEVEVALDRHIAALACAGVARPDPKRGETSMACAGSRAESTATDADRAGPAGAVRRRASVTPSLRAWPSSGPL